MTEFDVCVHPILLNQAEGSVLNPLLKQGDHLCNVALFFRIEPEIDDCPVILLGPHRMASALEADLPDHPLTRDAVLSHVRRVHRVSDLVEVMLRYGGTHVIKTRAPADTLITLSGDLVGMPKIKAVVSGLGYKDRIHYISPLEVGLDPSFDECKKLIEGASQSKSR